MILIRVSRGRFKGSEILKRFKISDPLKRPRSPHPSSNSTYHRYPSRVARRYTNVGFLRPPIRRSGNRSTNLEVASWRGKVDAILLGYQPGQEGGHAIADVLLGKVNPSGKLATSFPAMYDDIPYAADFPGRVRDGAPAGNMMTGQPSDHAYNEGVFVGYRYSGTFGKAPAYVFGHGMSYTTFGYGGLQLTGAPTNAPGSLTVKVTVTNTGRVVGREVAQLYVTAPHGTLDKPERELRALAKTGVLAPGASETRTFRLSAADVASFDPAASAWVADAGTYTVRVAGSSAAEGVHATFAIGRSVIVERTRHLVAPITPVAELKAPSR